MRFVVLLGVLQLVAGEFKVLILHTNDMHSRWAGIDAEGGAVENDADSEYGNIIRLKMAVEREIKCANRHVLFLNAGDSFDGTPAFTVIANEDKILAGALTGEVIKSAGFDALSLGNHEFDIGKDGLEAFLEVAGTNTDELKEYLEDNQADIYESEANFLQDSKEKWKTINFSDKSSYATTIKMQIFVAANYIKNEIYPLHKKIKKSVVRIFRDEQGNAVPIGIIGYLTRHDTKKEGVTRLNAIDPEKIILGDEIAYVKKESERLNHMGVKIIIALGHAGIEIDKQIAALEHISAVVGGHTNTFMFNHYGEPEADPGLAVLPYPVLVPKIDNDGNYYMFTPVVQALGYIKYLGKLELDFDANGSLLLNDCTNAHGALSTFTDAKQNPILLKGKIVPIEGSKMRLGAHPNSPTMSISEYNGLKNFLNKYHGIYAGIFSQSQTWKPTDMRKVSRFLEGGEICRTRECELGGIIADSQVHWFQGLGKTIPNDFFKGVIGVMNGGGIRGQIGDVFVNEKFPKQIGTFDLLQVLDMKLTVVAIEVSQLQLKEIFSIGISQWKDKAPTGRFLHVSSNVRLEIDFADQTSNILIDSTNHSIPKFRLFVKDVKNAPKTPQDTEEFVDVLHSDYKEKKFIVLSDSHIGGGRCGYKFMLNANRIATGPSGVCVLGDYFAKTTIGDYNSRIKFINDNLRLDELRK